jgi:hypothetical protein
MIGLILLYNILFNYFFAWFVKPGSPWELSQDEDLRKEIKQREHRKEVTF